MKKIAVVTFLFLAVVGLNYACSGSNGSNKDDVTLKIEAVHLREETYFVVRTDNAQRGLEEDLLCIRSDIEQPEIGALYTFELEDAIADSYPGQAAAKSAEKLRERAGVVTTKISLAHNLLNHLPEVAHLIDVRTPAEYDSGHIPQSINISSAEIVAQIAAVVPNQDEIILLYCRSGNRSARAAKELENLGYKVVFDLGGISDYEGDLE